MTYVVPLSPSLFWRPPGVSHSTVQRSELLAGHSGGVWGLDGDTHRLASGSTDRTVKVSSVEEVMLLASYATARSGQC